MADVKAFDPYEYVGVIAPGAIVVAALLVEWPQAQSALGIKEFSLGDLGIFVIFAFALGHIVQALGNAIEWALYFPFGGKPTDWVKKPGQKLIAPQQRARLIEAVARDQGIDIPLDTIDGSAWYSMVREIFAKVSAEGRNGRIDAFNRNYGLLRGIAAALLVTLVWFLATRGIELRWTLMTFALLVLALYRMYHFGVLYAREVFVQYLTIPPKKDSV